MMNKQKKIDDAAKPQTQAWVAPKHVIEAARDKVAQMSGSAFPPLPARSPSRFQAIEALGRTVVELHAAQDEIEQLRGELAGARMGNKCLEMRVTELLAEVGALQDSITFANENAARWQEGFRDERKLRAALAQVRKEKRKGRRK